MCTWWYIHSCSFLSLIYLQVFMQSGQPPTVLQQLCLLPFQYFSDPALTNVLFPTLIACCYRSNANREILEQELSCDLLANFIEVGHIFNNTCLATLFCLSFRLQCAMEGTPTRPVQERSFCYESDTM